ncbi:MAG: hypothetical protein M9962_04890 [Oligoflexia bacterium]|nr:hypothetical protein [Oligoflexia bacterium]
MIADLQRQLGIDSSFFPLFIIFVFVFLWLRYVYFSPFINLIKEREKSSEGANEAAGEENAKAKELEEELLVLEKTFRKKVIELREEKVKAVQVDLAGVFSKEKEIAKKQIESARAQALENEKSELKALEAQVDEYSIALASKLTNNKVRI